MITKRRLLFFIGTLIVLNAVLFGLPFIYESSLNIALGLFVIVIAFLYGRTKSTHHHRSHHKKREKSTDVYAETRPEEMSGVATDMVEDLDLYPESQMQQTDLNER